MGKWTWMPLQGTWVWGRAQCRHGCPTEHPPPATTRSLPHSVWRRPCHGMVLWTFIFCTLTLPPSTTTAMFTQLTAKQGVDKTIDSSSNLPPEPVFLWLHPDLLPWWWVGLVCPFQTVFHLPNRWSIAYIPCILISWVQLRRWPHVSDLQIWGGGVFPLVHPYSAKGDVRERAETVSSPFHLDISLYSWDNFPDFVCVGGAPVCVQVHMHVCKHTCRSQGQSQTVFLGNHPLGFWDRVSLWEAGLAD